MVICYDIEFRDPAEKLINMGITDMMYSPILHQAWSRLYQANLIASNLVFYPWKGGAGLYSQGEIIDYFLHWCLN